MPQSEECTCRKVIKHVPLVVLYDRMHCPVHSHREQIPVLDAGKAAK